MDKLIINDQEYELVPLEERGDNIWPSVLFKGNTYIGKAIVKEKPKEKEWEVLSYRVPSTFEGYFLFTKKSGDLFCSNNNNVEFPILEEQLNRQYKTEIHSFKRLSDGEVFTVGDICDAGKDYPGYPAKPIKKIWIRGEGYNTLIVTFDEGGNGGDGSVSFRDVQHSAYMCTTDGGKIYGKQKLWRVTPDLRIVEDEWDGSEEDKRRFNVDYGYNFQTEEQAEKYRSSRFGDSTGNKFEVKAEWEHGRRRGYVVGKEVWLSDQFWTPVLFDNDDRPIFIKSKSIFRVYEANNS